MRDLRVTGVAVIFTATLALACSDPPTGPVVGTPASPSLVGTPDVQVVHRQSPLSEDEVVSRTIGPLGGAISLPTAGLTVTVPAGAVLAPTTITVTAPAGELVGYHFRPDGLVFEVPLVAVQDLSGTTAPQLSTGRMLTAAYFEGELAPTVEALELLPLSLSGTLGTFEIDHFSGYVVATN